MPVNPDFKLIKEKKIDKHTTLKISQNFMSGRIFVEFVSDAPKMVLQKNFEDSFFGKLESDRFAKSIKGISDLKAYFGVK